MLKLFRDEYCPRCDNHYVVNAVEPKAVLEVKGEDVRIDSRQAISLGITAILSLYRMLKDDRIKEQEPKSIFDVKDAPERLG